MKNIGRVTTSIIVSLLMLVIPLKAYSAEAALYAPIAPEGSAYIRIFNNSSSVVDMSIGDKLLKDIKPFEMSDYIFLEAGSYKALLGDSIKPVQLESNNYYTLASDKGSALLITDPQLSKKTKALLNLYNFVSTSKADLKTGNGKVKIISGVSSNNVESREIKGVKVNLAVFLEEEKLTLGDVTLKRGESYNVFVVGKEHKKMAFIYQGKTNTRI